MLMKTFKIVALALIEQTEKIDLPLKDGLIINMEDEQGKWVIEAFIDDEWTYLFRKKAEIQESFDVEVIITHRNNEPALFSVSIEKIREINRSTSILLEGILKTTR